MFREIQRGGERTAVTHQPQWVPSVLFGDDNLPGMIPNIRKILLFN